MKGWKCNFRDKFRDDLRNRLQIHLILRWIRRWSPKRSPKLHFQAFVGYFSHIQLMLLLCSLILQTMVGMSCSLLRVYMGQGFYNMWRFWWSDRQMDGCMDKMDRWNAMHLTPSSISTGGIKNIVIPSDATDPWLIGWVIFSTPVLMHGGLICITFCLPVRHWTKIQTRK